jgi:hypothetical protein
MMVYGTSCVMLTDMDQALSAAQQAIDDIPGFPPLI